MTLTYAVLRLELPFAESKKGRRAVLNSIKERLARMNCSVLDLSGEYPKEGEIGIAFLSPDEQQARQKIEKIEAMLESRYPDIHAEITYESL
ncbi:DUF503 family protein [Hydrogenimonas urashimensis]|uniref:DUF503 family protein n=1 Tax=Hydrogenimonas urashimensis TaxID=2740515 RepID=UPI001915791A|nr:DUF503 family protein [Hydrogenimonas urashimensis]